jgi:spermidine synthase
MKPETWNMEPETLQDEEYTQRNWRIFFALGLMGFITAIAQITFLRRGIANFSGNELGLAIGLLAWLAWVGLGGLLSRLLFPRLARPDRALYLALLLLAVLFPLTTAALDLVRPVMGIPVGQVVGFGFIGLSYMLLLAPFCLVDGSDFTFGAAAAGSGRAAAAFAAESLGAASGGLFFFFAGVRYFDSIELAWTMSAVVAVSVPFLAWRDILVRWTSIVLLVGSLSLVVFTGVPSTDLTRGARYAPYFPVMSTQSPLGHLTWAVPVDNRSREGEGANSLLLDQSVLFYDGSPLMTDPDLKAAELAAHPGLMVHPYPEKVLLISSHLTGVLQQVLTHPVDRVDTVVLDEAVVRMESLNIRSTINALADPRSSLVTGDARQYVRTVPDGAYDVILINLPDPGTLLFNRFYSAEFFRDAARVLADDGVLALSIGEPSNYIPPAMGRYLASMDAALSPFFSQRAWYPLNRYVALCGKDKVRRLTGSLADGVIHKRGLDLKFIRSHYLDADLSGGRLSAVEAAMDKASGQVRPNSDMTPSTVLYRLLLWQGRTGYAGILAIPDKAGVWLAFVVGLLILIAGCFAASLKGSGGSRGLVLLSLGGFAGIAAETVLMYLYQAGYGFLYSRIALLVAAFMAGMALGAMARVRNTARPAWLWTGYFLVVTLVVWIDPGAWLPEWTGLALFLLLMTGAGALTGVSFNVGSGLLESSGWRHPGGAAYGVDLLGAALGTVICGLILPLAVGLFAPIRYCLLLSVSIAAGLSIGKNS